jgi:hypothetical protein
VSRRNQPTDMVSIHMRPPEIEDRLMFPGQALMCDLFLQSAQPLAARQ